MLDSELILDLRSVQADVIKKTSRSVSFSKIINAAAKIGTRKVTVQKMIKELDLK